MHVFAITHSKQSGIYSELCILTQFLNCLLFRVFFVLLQNVNITKTYLFKNTGNFTTKKNENYQIKNSDIFHISAQNIDCGYLLEPPRRGGSNEYHNLCF